MQGSHEEEPIFHDAVDHVSSCSGSPPAEDSIENLEFESAKHLYEIWTEELKSVSERRQSFLRQMELDELVTPEHRDFEVKEADAPSGPLELERMTEISGAELDSLSSAVDGCNWDLDCCIRDLDSGKKFLVHELGRDGLPCSFKESGVDKLITFPEFEKTLGISRSVQQLMHRGQEIPSGEDGGGSEKSAKKSRSWLKNFAVRSSFRNAEACRVARMKVKHNSKRCKEFTAVYMGQEIKGHVGSILVMKFSSDGRYLATGGEDCVVRVWSVDEVDASSKHLTADGGPMVMDNIKANTPTSKSSSTHNTPIVIPRRVFRLGEKPTQEFHGHTNDILDLSWSKSNCLLTASKDKTTRFWKIGCDDCLHVFRHNNYVTCIQFDPVDDEYFISGSVDGKVRIWGIKECHVIDWVEVRDIVTAVSYQPNGQGFVVGTICGNCRFYDLSGDSLQLVNQLFIQGKKKAGGKRITGFQFAPDDGEKVMITSGDSKVRVVDGVDVIQKFKGLRKSRSQLFASFTEDGKYIVSVDGDSRIYIWNCSKSNTSRKGLKSIRSCEHFFSEGVVVAVPWPGIDHISKETSGSHPCLKNLKLFGSSAPKDIDRLSLGGLFSTDGVARMSATMWPEEKLAIWAKFMQDWCLPPDRKKHGNHYSNSILFPSPSWSRVIVAAGRNGAIRTFLNYGLPVRV